MNANKEIKMSGVANGHQWPAHQARLKVVNGAMSARVNTKLIIGEMQKIAEKHGGKCLSDSYINSKTKLLWQCARGHQWEEISSNIKRGQWYRICGIKKNADALRLDITEMRQVAEKRGGKCLSDAYVNAKTKLMWQCADGHRWKATPNNIKNGQWCRICGISKRADARKLDIKEMQQIAEKRGGKCLSDTYANSFTKLWWKCEKGHQWPAIPNSIKRGSWCPICGIKNRADALRLDIAEMCQIAESRGGKCLSDTYVDSNTKLIWQCADGHKWEATPGMIKSGTWCTKCSSSLGERICREFFEQLFGDKFPKCYPKWLINKNGNKMELDGYCQSLDLAFEHHGEQHYSVVKFFSKSEKCLRKRQGDDKVKRDLCVQQGIVLVEVPEIPRLLPIKDVKMFIKKECERNGIPLPIDFDINKVDLNKAYATAELKVALAELKLIAEERGGKCLSDTYVNAHTKLLWECEKGHQWPATPNQIKCGRWCRICGIEKGADALRLDIAEMCQIAERRGGKCLSDTYVNANTKLIWQCAYEHRWEATPSMIKSNYWCPKCARVARLTIEEMHQLAEKRSGKCLSETYVNNRTKLLWQCTKGHQWAAIPRNIKRGQWCRICSGSAKLTIEEMHQLAEKRGGKCLSDSYTDNKTKLLWQCAKGRQWEAIPSSIKRGQWCSKCAGIAKLTIEEMQKIADARNGKCLSDSYINSKRKLLWECKKKHQWEAAPVTIKAGKWCRVCAGNAKLTIGEMQKIAEKHGGKCLSDTYINSKTKLLWQCAKGYQWEAIPSNIKRGQWCWECYQSKKGESE